MIFLWRLNYKTKVEKIVGRIAISIAEKFLPCLATRKRISFRRNIKKINNTTYIDACSHKTRLFHSSCSAKLLHIFTGSALATVLSLAIFTLPTSSAPASDSWTDFCTKHWSSWTGFPCYWFLLQQNNNNNKTFFLTSAIVYIPLINKLQGTK